MKALGRSALSLGPVLGFLSELWLVDHEIARQSKRSARERGLTGPQRLVLRIVGRFPGLPPGELAQLLHVHASTLSGVIARLSRAGLLARSADPSDRRRVRLELTARGRRVDARPLAVEGAVRRVLADARAEDVEGARAVLRALASELEQELEDGAPRASLQTRRGRK